MSFRRWFRLTGSTSPSAGRNRLFIIFSCRCFSADIVFFYYYFFYSLRDVHNLLNPSLVSFNILSPVSRFFFFCGGGLKTVLCVLDCRGTQVFKEHASGDSKIKFYFLIQGRRKEKKEKIKAADVGIQTDFFHLNSPLWFFLGGILLKWGFKKRLLWRPGGGAAGEPGFKGGGHSRRSDRCSQDTGVHV